jgi:hypothetical protein
MKPLGYRNYGSIAHLSNSKLGEHDKFIHIGQEKILTEKTRDKHDKIYVFEKYDGSNVGIAKINGKIIALTRSGYEAHTSPYLQHHVFHVWVQNRKNLFSDVLKEGERLAAEWVVQSASLKYEIIGEPIRFFDVFNPDNTRKHIDFLKELDNYFTFIPMARKLYEGYKPIKAEMLIHILNEGDTGCEVEGEKPEGMVYRCERKGEFDFAAKWVRPDFVPGKNIIGKEPHEYVYNEII